MASTEIFGISVLVNDNDCVKQPSYVYCREGTEWFYDHCKTAHHYGVLALIWLVTYDLYSGLLASMFVWLGS